MTSRTSAEPAALPTPEVIATDPRSSFSNSTKYGVNRIVALGDYLLVNNIGANCEVWQFAPGHSGHESEVRHRALFNTTIFPGQDLPSIFDVDAHAAFLLNGGKNLLLSNHYGRLRCFDLTQLASGKLPLVSELSFRGDTERILLVDGCLVTTSPRGQFTPDPAEDGLLISAPLADLARGPTTASDYLDYVRYLPGWGTLTALATDASRRLLAVGAAQRLGLFEFEASGTGLTLGRCLWERSVPYLPQWLGIDTQRGRVLVAGYEDLDADPTGDDWDALSHGGFAVYSQAGDLLLKALLPATTAWGYGADAVVPSSDYSHLYALDRSAALHSISTDTGESSQLYPGAAPDERTWLQSPGIGHCEVIGRSFYAGFSRGGYRLFRYALPADSGLR